MFVKKCKKAFVKNKDENILNSGATGFGSAFI